MPAQTRMQHGASSLIRDSFRVLLLLILAPVRSLPAAEVEVPYIPTPQVVVDRMLEMARVRTGDYLIDLGSGDGRIVITAAKRFGVQGFGVDIDPERIQESNDNARRAGVADRVAFYQRDLFETDLSEATVITMYLLPRVNLALRPRLLALRPGTRVVSHDFSMDAWRPDEHVVVDLAGEGFRSSDASDIYLWYVPAHVAGRWIWNFMLAGHEEAYEVVLKQRYQDISGTIRVGGRSFSLDRARIQGGAFHLEFTVDINGARMKHVLDGKVDGDDLSGTALLSGERIQSRRDWTARRVERAAMTTDDTGRSRYASKLPFPQ